MDVHVPCIQWHEEGTRRRRMLVNNQDFGSDQRSYPLGFVREAGGKGNQMRGWACFETKPARRWETLLLKIRMQCIALELPCITILITVCRGTCVSRGPRFVPQRHLRSALGLAAVTV